MKKTDKGNVIDIYQAIGFALTVLGVVMLSLTLLKFQRGLSEIPFMSVFYIVSGLIAYYYHVLSRLVEAHTWLSYLCYLHFV